MASIGESFLLVCKNRANGENSYYKQINKLHQHAIMGDVEYMKEKLQGWKGISGFHNNTGRLVGSIA